MKKIGKFLKGVAKGVRDVSPVPSGDAEKETVKNGLLPEQLGQKMTSRGVMLLSLIYALDQVFSLGLFS